MARFLNLLSLPWGSKALIFEAAAALCLSWLIVRLVPFRYWSEWVGNRTTSEFLSQTPSTDPQLGRVKWAIDKVSKRVPSFTCLMIALAGQGLLRRRKIRSVMVFGVDIKHESQGARTIAHAWLTSGPHVLFGQAEKDRYKAVFFISSPDNSRSCRTTSKDPE